MVHQITDFKNLSHYKKFFLITKKEKRKKQKQTKTRGVAQVEKHLSSKSNVLSSTTSTAKNETRQYSVLK
jgi:hypothetical protein